MQTQYTVIEKLGRYWAKYEHRYLGAVSVSKIRTYTFPLFTPAGANVLQDNPPDHLHHQGIEVGQDYLNGHNFWAMGSVQYPLNFQHQESAQHSADATGLTVVQQLRWATNAGQAVMQGGTPAPVRGGGRVQLRRDHLHVAGRPRRPVHRPDQGRRPGHAGAPATGNVLGRPDPRGHATLSWDALTPAGTSVRFQLRSAATAAGLDARSYLGPDGTSATYYTAGGTALPALHRGDAWVQYQVTLETANPLFTPYLHSVTLRSVPTVVEIEALQYAPNSP